MFLLNYYICLYQISTNVNNQFCHVIRYVQILKEVISAVATVDTLYMEKHVKVSNIFTMFTICDWILENDPNRTLEVSR